jgi:hypothetical protein
MDTDRIAQNLACVEKHFHSEAVDAVETALDLYTEDIIWDAPARRASPSRQVSFGSPEGSSVTASSLVSFISGPAIARATARYDRAEAPQGCSAE